MRWLADRWTDEHAHQARHEPEWWFLVGVAILLAVLITTLNIYASSL